MLQKVQLGDSDIFISPLGLGTVKFGRNQKVKYPTAFSLPDDQAIKTLLSQAQTLGINFLDTAPAYGTSEERLGQLIEHRDDWVICTKVGEEFIEGESSFDFSGKHIRTSIERSLQRLKTDYLDIVLVHSHGDDLKIIEQDEVFQTLSKLKQQGLIRTYGMSTKTIAGGLATVAEADVVMVTYHQGYAVEMPVIEKAHHENKAILIKKALGSGHMKNIDEALSFVMKTPGVTSAIVGTINPKHLSMNVRCVESIILETSVGRGYLV